MKVVWLYPKQWNGRVVVWLDDSGKAALRNADGSLKPAVLKLVQSGAAVLGADLLFQGGEPVKQTRVVANPREFAGYTFGYNHALFAQRTHDVLTIVSFLRQRQSRLAVRIRRPSPSPVGAAPVPSSPPPARWPARRSTAPPWTRSGFRFGKLLDYRDPMFLPGGAKYLDLPGLLALGAPHPLWLAGEGQEPAIVTAAYRAASPGRWTGDLHRRGRADRKPRPASGC